MTNSNPKLGLKFTKTSKCCLGIEVYIDRERINAIALYPLDRDRKRVSNAEELDLEFNIAELKVRDIEDIALLMNKETFDRFCELWMRYHNENENNRKNHWLHKIMAILSNHGEIF